MPEKLTAVAIYNREVDRGLEYNERAMFSKEHRPFG